MPGFPVRHRVNARRGASGEDRVPIHRIIETPKGSQPIPETQEEGVRTSWRADKYHTYRGPYIKGDYLYIPKQVLKLIDRAMPQVRVNEVYDHVVPVYAWNPGMKPTLRIEAAEKTGKNGKPLHALKVRHSSSMTDKIYVKPFVTQHGLQKGMRGVAYAVVRSLPSLPDGKGRITSTQDARNGKILAIEIDFSSTLAPEQD